MIDDLYAEQAMTAVQDRIANPLPQPKQEPRFSVWRTVTAIPRAVTEATAQVAATVAEVTGGAAQVLGAYPEMFGPVPLTAQQRADADRQRERLLSDGVDMSNDVGEALRAAGRSYRPDPQTAHGAEQVIYGFARGASKVVAGAMTGGTAGVLTIAAEEGVSAADDLRLQGVPLGARSAAGAVQGAGLGLAALPLIGNTLGQTAALYLAGGPGGFMAQQALTREILQNAGQDKVAEQFDPFDPVGLSISALVPAGFAAYGIRAQRLQRAAASLPNYADLPRDPAAAPDLPTATMPEPVPSALTPIADAVQRYPTERISQEVIDAAMVMHLRQRSMMSEELARTYEAPGQRIESLAEFVAREKIKPEPTPADVPGNFLAFVRDAGGIDLGQKLDITGDASGVRNNPAGIFRTGGRGTDELAMLAEEAGYLRPGEGADSGRLVELVQAAVRGERVLTLTEQMAKAAREQHLAGMAERMEAVEGKLRLLGEDPAAAGGNLAAMEAYVRQNEPRLLAAALAEARAAADDAGGLGDELRARAQQIAADVRDGGRTLLQYEREVQALSPVMRRLVTQELEGRPTDAPTTAEAPNGEAAPPAGAPGAAADGVPAAGSAADQAPGFRAMTADEKAAAQRAVVDLRKRQALVSRLLECIG